MKIQDALTDYQYKNVGQFMGIAGTLGYTYETHQGIVTFTGEDGKFNIPENEIRSHTRKEIAPELLDKSQERICQFLDKENALSKDYEQALRENGISIRNWGDLEGDAKDRFTVIDHQNKVCYTGKELYDYAFSNGYLLDGKGTQLEKGVLSELMVVNGKPAKMRRGEKGMSYFYQKDSLVLPDSILGQKLSPEQCKDLQNGKTVVLTNNGKDAFLQVDKELNSVVVRSHKELSIPVEFGKYKLTPEDKYLLANGQQLDNKLLHSEQGYLLADINRTENGYMLSHVQMIPDATAKELLQGKSAAIESGIQLKDSVKVETAPGQTNIRVGILTPDIDIKIRQTIEKEDFIGMVKLKEQGYKPSKELIRSLEKSVSINSMIAIKKVFGIDMINELSASVASATVKQDATTIQDALTTYQYKNVGQFKGIAKTLGYTCVSCQDMLSFTNKDGEFNIPIDEIRSHTRNEIAPELLSQSQERICQFLDKENALSEEYERTLLEKGISILNWGDLKGDAKDRFTVIDHQNKVCYTGKELYNYASMNNYLLDGKGTKFEKDGFKNIKLAQSKSAGKESNIRHTLANTINRAFSDL